MNDKRKEARPVSETDQAHTKKTTVNEIIASNKVQVNGETQAAMEFLEQIYRYYLVIITVITIYGRTITQTFNLKTDYLKCEKFIGTHNGKNNIYFSVNPPGKKLTKKASKADIECFRFLHVDIDPRDDFPIEEEQKRILEIIKAFELPPTFIVFSGGGYQCFWCLSEPVIINNPAKIIELESYNKELAIQLGGDKCHNIDRIMRLPGTVNIPNAKKRKKERKPALACVVEIDLSRVYSLEEFSKAQDVNHFPPLKSAVEVNFENLPKIDLDALQISDRYKRIIREGNDSENPYPSRSEALFAVLCELVRKRIDDTTIASLVLNREFKISESILDKKDPTRYATRQIERAKRKIIPPEIEEMNKTHAVAWAGNNAVIIKEEYDKEGNLESIHFVREGDMRLKYANKIVWDPLSRKYRKLFDYWLTHPFRREYEGVVFAPEREIPGYYNLYQGWGVTPDTNESCELFLKHTKEIICNGDKKVYDYLISLLAYWVQNPEEKPGIAIVIKGPEGVGKGSFAIYYGKIFGKHFKHLIHSDLLVGQFNSHLKDCILCFADENFFAGDKKHEGVLKGLITEKTITINEKYKNPITIQNLVHLIMASNSDWVIPAGLNARRFLVLEVSDKREGDTAYFKALFDEMKGSGPGALFDFLKKYDCSKVDLRNVPKTSALMEQKERSMSPMEKFWYGKLWSGRLSDENYLSHDWDCLDINGFAWISTDDFYEDFVQTAKSLGYRYIPTKQEFGRETKRLCPSRGKEIKTLKKLVNYQRNFQNRENLELQSYPRSRRAYCYPSLERCRKEFEKILKHPIEWPEQWKEETKDKKLF